MAQGAAQPSGNFILLIGDDLQFSYLITRYARSQGCNVINAGSLVEALLTIADERPALIVLHGLLAPADDWCVLRVLKQERTTRSIPVAVCSAAADEVCAREAGADCWLSQPVLYGDFLAALAATEVAPSSDLNPFERRA